jgi:hypothetical protein
MRNQNRVSAIGNLLLASVVICAFLCGAVQSNAVTVTVDPSQAWIGYMNVFNLPGSPPNYPPAMGAYQFGSAWGTADLTATWSGPVLTLGPNSINDPNPYWYIPSGGPGAIGNKIMDANMYVEIGSLPGQTLTFTGDVLANTLLGSTDPLGNGWTSVAFIKDFAPDYSSYNTVTIPIAPGPFSISLATVNDPTRHVQYGFETIGPDVWITDSPQYGNIQVIPEPGTIGLVLTGLFGVWMVSRKRRQS